VSTPTPTDTVNPTNTTVAPPITPTKTKTRTPTRTVTRTFTPVGAVTVISLTPVSGTFTPSRTITHTPTQSVTPGGTATKTSTLTPINWTPIPAVVTVPTVRTIPPYQPGLYDIRITDFTLGDPFRSFSVRSPLYALKPSILWVQISNLGTNKFSPTADASYTLHVSLKDANGNVLEEKRFTPGKPASLKTLNTLSGGDTQVLQIAGFYLFQSVADGSLEVVFDPDPALGISPSVLSKQISVIENPQTNCSCALGVIKGVLRSAVGQTNNPAIASGTFADGVATWGCGRDPREILAALAKWYIEALAASGLNQDRDIASAALLVWSELAGLPEACLDGQDWLNTFQQQLLLKGFRFNSVLTESPVYPVVSNAAGQRTGFLVDGTRVVEIPGSQARQYGEKRLIVFPGQGSFQVTLFAYNAGSVDLHTCLSQADGTGLTISFENVQVGSKTVAQEDTSNSQSLLVDSNGDGKVEQSIPPTRVLKITEQELFPTSTPSTASGSSSPFAFCSSLFGLILLPGAWQVWHWRRHKTH
jgi:hypothetical protein